MKVYKLQYPLEWDGKKIESIEIRRPKGKYLKKLNKSTDMGSIIGIASDCSDYTPQFFDELDGVDYIGVTEVIGDFLDVGQGTGRS